MISFSRTLLTNSMISSGACLLMRDGINGVPTVLPQLLCLVIVMHEMINLCYDVGSFPISDPFLVLLDTFIQLQWQTPRKVVCGHLNYVGVGRKVR